MLRSHLLLFTVGCFFAQEALADEIANPAPEDQSSDYWDLYASLGGSLEGRTGVEVELGVKFQPVRWIEFGFSPANLVLFENEDDQYESQSFSNGNTVCRDLSNGQFADESHCAPDVSWRGTATGEFNLGDHLSLGGGYLFGEQDAAFGSLRYNFNDTFSLLGRAGDEYASVALVAHF
jgi:hypothetical protein